MQLKQLTIDGLKHADSTTYDFDGPTAVLGPNQTGKTTIREALELLALGYCPELGKTNAATMSLAPADCDTLRVVGVFERDGKSLRLERSWSRKGKGITAGAKATGAKNRQSAEQLIALVLGDIAPVLHVDHFISMSPGKRRTYLFDHVGHLSGVTVEAVVAMLDKIGHTDRPEPAGYTADTYTAVVLAAAVDERKAGKIEIKEAKAVIADLKERLALIDVEGDPDGTGNEALKRLESDRDDLAAQLRDRTKTAATARKLRDDVARLESRESDISNQVLASPAIDGVDDRIAEARKRIAECDRMLTELDAEIAAADTQATKLVVSLTELSLAMQANTTIVETGGECPTCGHRVDALDLEIAEGELDEQRLSVAALNEASADVDKIIAGLNRVARCEQQQRSALSVEVARLETAKQTESMREVLDAQLMAVRKDLADKRFGLVKIEKAADGGDDGGAARLAELERQIIELKASVGDVASMRERLKRRSSELRALSKSLKQTQKAIDALGPQGVQGEIAESILGPLSTAANRMVEAADLGRLSFVTEAANRPVLDVVLSREGLPDAPLATLSGGETAVVMAALSAGFGAVCETGWRPVILDGLEAIDFGRRRELLIVLGSMHEAGEVDDALVFGCQDDPEVPYGWATVVTT